jgi:alpha-mannosidase
VSTPGFDAAQLTRLGWESTTHLESDPVHASNSSRILPPSSASFLSIDHPEAALITLKLAEDGEGSVLRLEDMSGKAEMVRVGSRFFHVTRAWLCNALEDKLNELPVGSDGIEVNVPAFGIVTMRLQTEPQPASSGGQS